MKTSAPILCLCLFVMGCGSSTPTLPSANYQIIVYNSTGQNISISYPGDPSTANDALSGPQAANIPAYKAITLFALSARPYEIKVVLPAGAEKLGRSIEIQPNTTKNLLVDLGGRGQFYKYPIPYGRFADMNKTVPPEFFQQFPVQELKGTNGLYELDQRFAGVNKAPPSKVAAPASGNVAAVYALVDAGGLRRVSEGKPLDRN